MKYFVFAYYVFAIVACKVEINIPFVNFLPSVIPFLAVWLVYSHSGNENSFRNTLLFLLGSVWGLMHHQFVDEFSSNDCGIVETSLFSKKSVANCRNRKAIVFGIIQEGSRGSVRCVKSSCRWTSRLEKVHSTTYLDSLSLQMKASFQNNLMERVPSNLLPYFKNMFFTKQSDFWHIENMKQLGLYHLFVISGFHVGLLYRWSFLVLMIIPRLLYLSALINPYHWRFVVGIATFFQVLAVLCLGLVVGAGTPFLRALITCAIVGVLLRTSIKKTNLAKLGLFIHILLSPYEGLTISFLLTWLISLIFLFSSQRNLGFKYRLAELVQIQVFITAVCLLILGDLPFNTLVVNLAFSMLLPILVSSMILCSLPWPLPGWVLGQLFDFQEWSFSMIGSFGNIFSDWNLSASDNIEGFLFLLVGLKFFIDIRKSDS